MEEELIQYYIVNSELGMSAGKVAAQVAHAATCNAMKYYKNEIFRKWYNNGQKKIILRAKTRELLVLEAAGHEAIHDAGHTEIPAGSLTVVALPVLTREEAKKITKKFQLY